MNHCRFSEKIYKYKYWAIEHLTEQAQKSTEVSRVSPFHSPYLKCLCVYLSKWRKSNSRNNSIISWLRVKKWNRDRNPCGLWMWRKESNLVFIKIMGFPSGKAYLCTYPFPYMGKCPAVFQTRSNQVSNIQYLNPISHSNISYILLLLDVLVWWWWAKLS